MCIRALLHSFFVLDVLRNIGIKFLFNIDNLYIIRKTNATALFYPKMKILALITHVMLFQTLKTSVHLRNTNTKRYQTLP